MVQAVVLMMPTRGRHPIGPIEKASPTLSKFFAFITLRSALGLVVAAVLNRMRDLCPARETSLTDQQRGNRIRRQPRRRVAEQFASLPPPLHAPHVTKIVRPHVGQCLLVELFDVFGQLFAIDRLVTIQAQDRYSLKCNVKGVSVYLFGMMTSSHGVSDKTWTQKKGLRRCKPLIYPPPAR